MTKLIQMIGYRRIVNSTFLYPKKFTTLLPFMASVLLTFFIDIESVMAWPFVVSESDYLQTGTYYIDSDATDASDAAPFPSSYELSNLELIFRSRCDNCYSPTAVAGIRGSKVYIDVLGDGTTTYGVVEGSAVIRDLITGDPITLSAGDVLTVSATSLILPESYTRSSPNTVSVSFRNWGAQDIQNITATLTSVPSGIDLIKGDVSIDGIISSLGVSVSMDNLVFAGGVEEFLNPNADTLWRIEYDDLFGIHRVFEDIPMFLGISSIARISAAEPATIALMTIGLVGLGFNKKLKT